MCVIKERMDSAVEVVNKSGRPQIDRREDKGKEEERQILFIHMRIPILQ